MTLSEYFLGEKIDLFAYLPADAVPVRMPRLLSGFEMPRTVVFAAVPYYTPDAPGANLARFARVRDYHAFAARLAAGAADCLRMRYPSARVMGFADHSPFDEVRGAALAGLGVLGDHGLIITDKYSSYIFLFALVTDLTADEMAAEGIPAGGGEVRTCSHCGACRRACPGGCIGQNRENCASAISQKKGDLTDAETVILRRATAAWGCDACQDACPYTAAAIAAGTVETKIPYFREHILGKLTPADVTNMTEDEYRSYAFGWRPKRVLIRNLTLREDDK